MGYLTSQYLSVDGRFGAQILCIRQCKVPPTHRFWSWFGIVVDTVAVGEPKFAQRP
jgi:hypothetical protein